MPQVINRLPPLEHESLQAYLERLRRANYYAEVGWYTHSTRADLVHSLHLLRTTTDLQLFSDLTGLSLESVFALTLHRYVPCFYTPDELVAIAAEPRNREYGDIEHPLWPHGGINQYVHRSSKVCPRCWYENNTMLLPWMLRTVTACPEHNVLLVERCPKCDRALRLNLATGGCLACGHVLARTAAESIGDDAMSVQLAQVEWSALLKPTQRGWLPSGVVTEGNPVLGMTPAEFHQFCHHMAKALLPYGPVLGIAGLDAERLGVTNTATVGKLRAIGNVERHNLYLYIWRLLQEWESVWPETLMKIAAYESAYIGAGKKQRTTFPGSLLDEFVGARWRWLHNSWMVFTREYARRSTTVHHWLFNYRLAEREGWASGYGWNGVGSKDEVDENVATTESADACGAGADAFASAPAWDGAPTLLTMPEAARILGLPPRGTRALVDRGKIPAVVQLGGGARGMKLVLVDADDVRRYAEWRGPTLSMAQVAERFDFSPTLVIEFVEAGLLTAESAARQYDATPWSFREADVLEFLESVMGNLPIGVPDANGGGGDGDKDLLTLRDVVSMKSLRRIGMAELLVAIKAGELPACRLTATPGAQGTPGVDAGSEGDSGAVDSTRGQVDAPLPQLRLQDVRLERETVRKFLDQPKGGLYTRNVTARMVGCNMRGMLRLYKTGLLIPSVGDPDKPNTWRYTTDAVADYLDRYIDGKAAAAMVGVNTASLYGWVRRGLLTAACGPLVDGTPLYRFDKYALAEWRAERLTIGEAVALTGLPPHRITKAAREGRVRILESESGGGRANFRWYSREDLLNLKRQGHT